MLEGRVEGEGGVEGGETSNVGTNFLPNGVVLIASTVSHRWFRRRQKRRKAEKEKKKEGRGERMREGE